MAKEYKRQKLYLSKRKIWDYYDQIVVLLLNTRLFSLFLDLFIKALNELILLADNFARYKCLQLKKNRGNRTKLLQASLYYICFILYFHFFCTELMPTSIKILFSSIKHLKRPKLEKITIITN